MADLRECERTAAGIPAPLVRAPDDHGIGARFLRGSPARWGGLDFIPAKAFDAILRNAREDDIRPFAAHDVHDLVVWNAGLDDLRQCRARLAVDLHLEREQAGYLVHCAILRVRGGRVSIARAAKKLCNRRQASTASSGMAYRRRFEGGVGGAQTSAGHRAKNGRPRASGLARWAGVGGCRTAPRGHRRDHATSDPCRGASLGIEAWSLRSAFFRFKPFYLE